MTTVVSVKMERKLKKEAKALAEKLGFPLGTLINAFLRQMVRNEAIHFSTRNTVPMSKKLEKELAEVERDIRKETHISPGFSDIHEAISYLHRNGH